MNEWDENQQQLDMPGGWWRFRRSAYRLSLCLLFFTIPMSLTAQTTSHVEGIVLDTHGRAIAGAEITLSGSILPREIKISSNASGSYRIPGLQPGDYQLRAEKLGFAAQVFPGLALTVNRALIFDIVLAVAVVEAEVTISATPPLLDTASSSSGATILRQQIEQMPLNGRNYLDLLQLVPGVAVNRRVDEKSDAAAPMLGERAGNAVFLIDGMPNSNAVDGGAGAPFDQDSILEFQVLTAGYKAEFGQGSGGVVNVVSRSGTNSWRGRLSMFHRNSAFDSSNVSEKRTPFLLRWDLSANLSGPVVKDHLFFFGAIERIKERRHLNFNFPATIPDFLREREVAFDHDSRLNQTRSFFKLHEFLGPHRVAAQVSLSDSHVSGFLPLSQATSLPSTRTNSDSRQLMLGLQDTATFGNVGNPFVFHAFVQYRREPSHLRPTSSESSASTLFNLFSSLTTNRLAGDLGQVRFGAGFTPLLIKQRYLSAGASVARLFSAHNIKFGWEVQRTRVDGIEATNQLNQLFATVSDFSQFGPVNSGVYVLSTVSGPTPADNVIRLRNLHNGLFVQDSWRLKPNLTLNIGLRWDYDSRFPNGGDLSPRLGFAWTPEPKTLITASWGMYYDRFRLGLARDIPGLGGANLFRNQTISYPRLFYGSPSTLPRLFGLCLSPNLTDAQIQASGATCPISGLPLVGIDHLNGLVAPGHTAIPLNSVVTLDNVQALTGLSPQQFADAASGAIGRQPGFFTWGGFGHLTMNFPVPQIFSLPITVDPGLRTARTRAFHIAIEREITSNLIIGVSFHHREIRDMLGVRTSNLAFEARLPGRAGELQPGTGNRPVLSYGPWYQGRYDGISIGIRSPFSKSFTLDASYTWVNAVDNALNSSFVSDVQTGRGAGLLGSYGATDSFVGVPPVVTDPVTGQTNATGSFIASNGNPVPKAGDFYDGANLDRGPSDLAFNHTLLMHGTARLPWRLEFSGILRVQSGFHFSVASSNPVDVDGDGILNGIDFRAGRNKFEAPPYANLDVRFSRHFSLKGDVRGQIVFEFFNLLNRANPAAVQQFRNLAIPLGQPLQYLPGREGQIGVRIDF